MPRDMTNWKGMAMVITALAGLVAAGASFLSARADATHQSKMSESTYNMTAEMITQLRVDVAGLRGEVEGLKLLVTSKASAHAHAGGSASPHSPAFVALVEPPAPVPAPPPKKEPGFRLPKFEDVTKFVEEKGLAVQSGKQLNAEPGK